MAPLKRPETHVMTGEYVDVPNGVLLPEARGVRRCIAQVDAHLRMHAMQVTASCPGPHRAEDWSPGP